jgi:hypothetical protein
VAENPYAPPKADVGTDPDEDPPRKPSAAARFLWTALIAFPIFFGFVLMTPREAWLMGALGSAMFAVLSGLVAMCIPVRAKALFIAPSILLFVVIAFLIGTANS